MQPIAIEQVIYKQPLVGGLKSPTISRLINNEFGREAMGMVNGRFKGNKLIEFPLDKYVEGQLPNFEEDKPIGDLNLYRKFALAPILHELDPSAFHLSPAISEMSFKNPLIMSDACSISEHLGLIVYSMEGPNSALAKHLVNQARDRKIEIEFPMVFYDLKTVQDGKFTNTNGLRFDLSDTAVPYPVPVAYSVPILSSGNGYSRIKSNDPELIKSGFPGNASKGLEDIGARILYYAASSKKNDTQLGLRGLIMFKYHTIHADRISLTESYPYTQMSFVNGASKQNLEAAIKKIIANNKRREAELEKGRIG